MSVPIEITKSDLISYNVRRRGAVWLDLSTDYGLNTDPLLVPDIQAVNNSLRNLLRCPIGSRGRTFRPTYGTYLFHALQEPIDEKTTDAIRASLVQSIEYWEPRIGLDYANTLVLAVPQLPGYVVKIAYFYRLTNQYVTTTFKATA